MGLRVFAVAFVLSRELSVIGEGSRFSEKERREKGSLAADRRLFGLAGRTTEAEGTCGRTNKEVLGLVMVQ